MLVRKLRRVRGSTAQERKCWNANVKLKSRGRVLCSPLGLLTFIVIAVVVQKGGTVRQGSLLP